MNDLKVKRIGQKNKLRRKNKMISAKEDMKNAITLEEKRYDGNSLIEDTYENSELVNTIKTGGGMEI